MRESAAVLINCRTFYNLMRLGAKVASGRIIFLRSDANDVRMEGIAFYIAARIAAGSG